MERVLRSDLLVIEFFICSYESYLGFLVSRLSYSGRRDGVGVTVLVTGVPIESLRMGYGRFSGPQLCQISSLSFSFSCSLAPCIFGRGRLCCVTCSNGDFRDPFCKMNYTATASVVNG